MSITSAPPATITLQADLYQSLQQHADAQHRPVDDLVSDLIKESLSRLEQEREQEIERQTQVMLELVRETERLGLYDYQSRP